MLTDAKYIERQQEVIKVLRKENREKDHQISRLTKLNHILVNAPGDANAYLKHRLAEVLIRLKKAGDRT